MGMRNFTEVIFSITFPTSSTLEVDDFLIYSLFYPLLCKLFLISITCCTLLRMRNFTGVIFSMTLPTPSTLKVDDFLIYRFFSSTSLQINNILLSAHTNLITPMLTHHY